MTSTAVRTATGFALLPDDGRPARLLRFSSLPDPKMLSMLIEEKNILLISPSQYDRLPEPERARLDITHEVMTTVVHDELGVRFEAYEPERTYPEPITHCH